MDPTGRGYMLQSDLTRVLNLVESLSTMTENMETAIIVDNDNLPINLKQSTPTSMSSFSKHFSNYFSVCTRKRSVTPVVQLVSNTNKLKKIVLHLNEQPHIRLDDSSVQRQQFKQSQPSDGNGNKSIVAEKIFRYSITPLPFLCVFQKY